MTRVTIGDSIAFELPEEVEVRQRSGGRRARGAGGGDDRLDAALEAAGLDIAAEVELVPTPRRRDRRGRRTEAPEAAAPPQLTVAVAPDQGAVVLVESSGGVFNWVLPETEAAADGRRRRGGAADRQLVFPLAEIAESRGPGRRDRRGRRSLVGWLGNRLIDPIRVRVLRFVVGKAIDFTLDKVEGEGRSFGLVDMSGPADGWDPGAAPPAPAAPCRVLLMVHGTFSTTRGSFSGLEATAEGQSFLGAARQSYDLVLGFDHRTLGHTPEQNARDIADALAGLPAGTRIDAVAFSRGGLVLRELVERVAPAGLAFERAVFVGCTNGGTHLAEPDNWDALIDLYTNIVMAGARALTLVSGGTAGHLISASISTIGRFVKLLPEMAIREGKVPGLEAMRPGGPVVEQLNQAAAADSNARYFVIASNFQPRIELSKGLTGELTEFLVNRIVDRFFQANANDLVVDTESMSNFGTRAPRLDAGEQVLLSATDVIYHIIYFSSARLGGLLGRWLLPMAGAARPIAPEDRPHRRRTRGAGPEVKMAPPPEFGVELEAAADAAPLDFGVDFGAAGTEPEAEPESFSFDAAAADEPPEPPARTRGRRSRSPVVRAGDGGDDVAEGPPSRRRGRKATPDPVTCHFAAEMDPTPVLDLPTPLFVTVSPERIQIVAGPAAAATEAPVEVERGRPIEIEVIPGRNCRVVGADDESPSPAADGGERPTGPALRRIDIPDQAISLRFFLEGFEPGLAEVIVEARQGAKSLASFLLKPVFTEASDARLSVTQTARATYAPEEEPAVMRILETHQADNSLRLRFDLDCDDPRVFVQEDVVLRPNFNLSAFVADFLAKLENAYDVDDYEGTLARIREFSIVSTNALIPPRVRAALWQYRDKIRAIQVISENPLIPWELLYVVDPKRGNKTLNGFLAEWGLVRWMYNATWPSRALRLRPDRVFHVIPDYLKPDDHLEGAQEERDMLTAKWAQAQPVEATSSGVRAFLTDRGGDCDLLHFACHGEAEQAAVLSSDLVMRGIEGRNGIVDDLLGQEAVQVNAAFGPDSPSGMVFINACQTGRPGEGIAGVMGFADSFIRPMSEQGVSAFIGALWSIDDGLALTFADTFYDRLLAGDTLVEAVRTARQACQDKSDFTWLAYSVYGHPFARVEKGQ